MADGDYMYKHDEDEQALARQALVRQALNETHIIFLKYSLLFVRNIGEGAFKHRSYRQAMIRQAINETHIIFLNTHFFS